MSEANPDEFSRILALQAAQWFYDTTGKTPDTPSDVTHMAEQFEDYINDGQTTTIMCNTGMIKFVRADNG